MKPIALFVMGRPGAGKDTQAEALKNEFNLIWIGTSALIQKKFLQNSDDPVTKREKEIFDAGELCTPSWILEVVKEHVEALVDKNFEGKNGIIFSGSPRTPYESENLLPFLENIFGKERMVSVYLDVPEYTGLERIRLRNKENPRALDTGEDKLKLRTKEFNERTFPAIKYLWDNYPHITINGTHSVAEITNEAVKQIKTLL